MFAIFNYLMIAYFLIAIVSYAVLITLDKKQNDGKVSPEGPFTYGILCAVWPYSIISIGYAKVRRYFRNRK